MATDPYSNDHGDESPASQNTGYLIWRVVNLWQKTQRAVLAPFELTPVQFLLLSGLAELAAEAVAIKQSALAQHCRTDAMMTSQVIRALEKRGLVRRARHQQDGRAVAVVLTEDGGRAVAEAASAVQAADAEFFAGLGDRGDEFADALTMLTGERPRRRVRALGA